MLKILTSGDQYWNGHCWFCLINDPSNGRHDTLHFFPGRDGRNSCVARCLPICPFLQQCLSTRFVTSWVAGITDLRHGGRAKHLMRKIGGPGRCEKINRSFTRNKIEVTLINFSRPISRTLRYQKRSKLLEWSVPRLFQDQASQKHCFRCVSKYRSCLRIKIGKQCCLDHPKAMGKKPFKILDYVSNLPVLIIISFQHLHVSHKKTRWPPVGEP